MKVKPRLWASTMTGIAVLYVALIGPLQGKMGERGIQYYETVYYPVLLSCKMSESVHSAIRKYCDFWAPEEFDSVFRDWSSWH
jgi:hypothetical protein